MIVRVSFLFDTHKDHLVPDLFIWMVGVWDGDCWDPSQRIWGLEWSSQQNPNQWNVGRCSKKLPGKLPRRKWSCLPASQLHCPHCTPQIGKTIVKDKTLLWRCPLYLYHHYILLVELASWPPEETLDKTVGAWLWVWQPGSALCKSRKNYKTYFQFWSEVDRGSQTN